MLNSKFHVPQHVRTTQVADEIILLDTERGEYFGLNATAAEIWKSVLDETPIERTIDDLCARFQRGPDEIRADVDRLLRVLTEKDLLIPVSSANGSIS